MITGRAARALDAELREVVVLELRRTAPSERPRAHCPAGDVEARQHNLQPRSARSSA